MQCLIDRLICWWSVICPTARSPWPMHLQGLRIVHDGFKSRAEAEKFIEDYYLARGVIAPPAPRSVD